MEVTTQKGKASQTKPKIRTKGNELGIRIRVAKTEKRVRISFREVVKM